jgi:hypothetical protein
MARVDRYGRSLEKGVRSFVVLTVDLLEGGSLSWR